MSALSPTTHRTRLLWCSSKPPPPSTTSPQLSHRDTKPPSKENRHLQIIPPAPTPPPMLTNRNDCKAHAMFPPSRNLAPHARVRVPWFPACTPRTEIPSPGKTKPPRPSPPNDSSIAKDSSHKNQTVRLSAPKHHSAESRKAQNGISSPDASRSGSAGGRCGV